MGLCPSSPSNDNFESVVPGKSHKNMPKIHMNDLYESYGDEDFMKTESQLKVAKLKKCRKECSLVINGLFDLGKLQENFITHVVNCAAGIIPENMFSDQKFQYLNLYLKDSADEDLSPHFKTTSQFIHQAIHGLNNGEVGRCLVHCYEGVSRSVSFVIAYLMEFHFDQFSTFDEAFKFVKGRREIASPNMGFISQLKQLEKQLKEEREKEMEEEEEEMISPENHEIIKVNNGEEEEDVKYEEGEEIDHGNNKIMDSLSLPSDDQDHLPTTTNLEPILQREEEEEEKLVKEDQDIAVKDNVIILIGENIKIGEGGIIKEEEEKVWEEIGVVDEQDLDSTSILSFIFLNKHQKQQYENKEIKEDGCDIWVWIGCGVPSLSSSTNENDELTNIKESILSNLQLLKHPSPIPPNDINWNIRYEDQELDDFWDMFDSIS